MQRTLLNHYSNDTSISGLDGSFKDKLKEQYNKAMKPEEKLNKDTPPKGLHKRISKEHKFALLYWVLYVYKKKVARLRHVVKKVGDTIFIITYVVSKSDYITISVNKELIKYDFSLPRGFPIIWTKKDGIIKAVGFFPKFSNDDGILGDLEIPSGTESVSFSQKFSGSMVLLVPFSFKNQKFLLISAKNSIAEFVCEPTYEMLLEWCKEKKLNVDTLLDTVEQNMLAISIESCFEPHGTVNKYRFFVVHGMFYTETNSNFCTSVPYEQMMQYAKEWMLPIAPIFRIEGQDAVLGFLNAMNAERDTMFCRRFTEICNSPEYKIEIVPGTITHEDTHGDVMEGLVLFFFENTGKFIKTEKFKFPLYVEVTMGFRDSLGDDILNNIQYPLPSATRIIRHALRSAKRWCRSEERQLLWINRLIQAYMMIKSDYSIRTKLLNRGWVGWFNSFRTTIEVLSFELLQNKIATLAEATCNIIVIIGPVASGKSYVGKHLAHTIPNSVHIDCDILDMTSELTTSANAPENAPACVLGRERNDMTYACIYSNVQQLLRNTTSTPTVIISAGGGQFITKNKIVFKEMLDDRFPTVSFTTIVLLHKTCGDENKARDITEQGLVLRNTPVNSPLGYRLLSKTKKNINVWKLYDDQCECLEWNNDFENVPSLPKLELESSPHKPWENKPRCIQRRLPVIVEGAPGHITIYYSIEHNLPNRNQDEEKKLYKACALGALKITLVAQGKNKPTSVHVIDHVFTGKDKESNVAHITGANWTGVTGMTPDKAGILATYYHNTQLNSFKWNGFTASVSPEKVPVIPLYIVEF